MTRQACALYELKDRKGMNSKLPLGQIYDNGNYCSHQIVVVLEILLLLLQIQKTRVGNYTPSTLRPVARCMRNNVRV